MSRDGVKSPGPRLRRRWALLSLMFAALLSSTAATELLPRLSHEYDFVVVGAGTAGAALAARLALAGNWSVALLEAGGDAAPLSDVPLLASYLARSPLDWDVPADADPGFCRALEGGRCRWHAGRALGGTSVINYMVYSRGSRKDYDAWEAQGCTGWGWRHVRPYFLRSEGARPPELARQPYHGTEGPVTVEFGWRSPLGEAFLEAAAQAGHALRDPHGPKQQGFSRVQATLRRGARCSAAKAYLEPMRGHPNLQLLKHAMAERVVLDPATRRATGVLFRQQAPPHPLGLGLGLLRPAGPASAPPLQEVRARKEVILAAGAMGSPKLLMLSGIGPADHLRQMGIPVFQELGGVGENLQDHVALGGLAFSVERAGATIVEARTALNLSMALDYLLRGQGALTLPGGAEVVGFLALPRQQTRNREARMGDHERESSEESLQAAESVSRTERGDGEENEAESDGEAAALGNAHAHHADHASPDEDDAPNSGQQSKEMEVEMEEAEEVEVEVVLGPGALSGDSRGSLRRALGLRRDYAARLLRSLRGRDAFSAVPIALRPRSRGRLRLRSNDPAQPLRVQPNYLRHPRDVQALVHGAKEAVRLSQMPALKAFGAKLNPVPYPGCEHLISEEDAYWECAVRQFTISMQHQVGTCKMGAAGDASAVVDPLLRVRGVRGLRVADASVMPLIPAGHTMAAAYMIGERAADLVARAWRRPHADADLH